jgi:hypothetical protein
MRGQRIIGTIDHARQQCDNARTMGERRAGNLKGKLAGVTRNRSAILAALACALVLIASYACRATTRSIAGPTRAVFPTLAPTNTSAPYIPAPSLTGWVVVSGTQVTVTATPPPTSTRTPTPTALPSSTPRPTNTPFGAPTATPIPPTATPQLGIYTNPVPVGSGFTIPDFGTLKVVRASWERGQTGLAIVELSFVCEGTAGQSCDTSTLILTAIGSSGTRYRRTFDGQVPEPPFGQGPNALVSGGGTATGNAGFIVQNSENSLMIQVQVLQRVGQFYMWIGTPGG